MWSCRTGTICMCMWNKIECRWAKFNNYPKYKSQLLAKTCPRHSTTSWNKEQWKKLTEQSEWQYHKYCTSNAKKALVQNLVDFDFLFSMIFWYFYQHKQHQNRNHTKFHLKQRVDVVYRKSNRYTEKRAGQKLNFLIIFLIFFEFFEIGLTGKVRWIVCATFRCQAPVKISAKTENRAKNYACFMEGISSYVFLRHNSADRSAAARAQILPGMRNG